MAPKERVSVSAVYRPDTTTRRKKEADETVSVKHTILLYVRILLFRELVGEGRDFVIFNVFLVESLGWGLGRE